MAFYRKKHPYCTRIIFFYIMSNSAVWIIPWLQTVHIQLVIIIPIIRIIEEECKRGRTSPKELKGGSRRRKASALRGAIAKRAVDELGLSMAEIARHVGVTTSSIAKAVARLEEEG